MNTHIEIDLRHQRLTLHRDGSPVFDCAISSSFVGTGSEPNSNRTPLGNFVIAEKIGDGAPLGSVFRNRQLTGEMANPLSPDDQITTRILWLDGTDAANANTRSRYIYLHGTNHEDQLGLPASHGCIRLANSAMLDLFEMVTSQTTLSIA